MSARTSLLEVLTGVAGKQPAVVHARGDDVGVVRAQGHFASPKHVLEPHIDATLCHGWHDHSQR
jgi:hypothetical protein